MNKSLSQPTNEYELGITLGCLLLLSRKVEVIFGSRYILASYLITLLVTSLSFLPCNITPRMNIVENLSNPNVFNFVFSQIIFTTYRLQYLNSPLLNAAFLGILVYSILPEGYFLYYETRNIWLSGLLTSALL